MRPRKRKDLIRSIRKALSGTGIDLIEDRQRGRGSHGSLIFQDRDSGRAIRVVIVNTGDVSPGVQRGILKYLKGIAGTTILAETVRRILEAIFTDDDGGDRTDSA